MISITRLTVMSGLRPVDFALADFATLHKPKITLRFESPCVLGKCADIT